MSDLPPHPKSSSIRAAASCSNTSDSFPGEQYVGRRSRAAKKKRDKRLQKSLRPKSRDSLLAPSSTIGRTRLSRRMSFEIGMPRSTSDIESQLDVSQVDFSYAEAKYVRKPVVEEPKSPLESSPYKEDLIDPLKRSSLSSDRFEDEMVEVTVDGKYHFNTMDEYEKKQKQAVYRRIGIAMVCLLNVVAVVLFILFFLHNGKRAPVSSVRDPAGNHTNVSTNNHSTAVPLVHTEMSTPVESEEAVPAESEGDPTTNDKRDAGVITSTTTQELMFPPAPDNLAYLCSGETDFTACALYCEEAACCWHADVDSCASQVPDGECRPYTEACSVMNLPDDEILNHINGPNKDERQEQSSAVQFVPAPLADLASLCSEEVLIHPPTYEIDPEALAACMDVCLPGECCWQSGGTVEMCPDNPECEVYASACSIIVHWND